MNSFKLSGSKKTFFRFTIRESQIYIDFSENGIGRTLPINDNSELSVREVRCLKEIIDSSELEVREFALPDLNACLDIYRVNNNDSTNEWVDLLFNELIASLTPNMFVQPKYFVVCVSGMVIGFAGYANCGFDADAFGLLWCNVHPMFKNKGVGKALVEVRLESIRQKGGKFILSSQREQVTWHLERFGFERLKENGEYDGDKYFLMHKNL